MTEAKKRRTAERLPSQFRGSTSASFPTTSHCQAIHVNTKVAKLEATKEGIAVALEGKEVPASATFDRVLVSVGRDNTLI